VARGAPAEDVFDRVVEEIGHLVAVDFAGMALYESDDAITFVAGWGGPSSLFSIGGRLMRGGKNVSTLVVETGRSARLDSYADASGPIGVIGRESGFRSSVATPITVEDRPWSLMAVGSSRERSLPADTEASRLVHGASGDGDRQCREPRRPRPAG
jgi:hypothetical protein